MKDGCGTFHTREFQQLRRGRRSETRREDGYGGRCLRSFSKASSAACFSVSSLRLAVWTFSIAVRRVEKSGLTFGLLEARASTLGTTIEV